MRFEEALKDHPNQPLVEFIVNGLRNGFDIGFQGQVSQQQRPNNKSARDNPEGVAKAIEKELERGHTAGPFDAPPFENCHISPLGAAPKPDGSCRLVLDLSQPQGESVNDHINKEHFPCSYMHFDKATELIARVGKGCYLSKIDIKHAYRILPVRPEDWHLLVYQWEGKYYTDVKLPFGGRSSASIFNAFADLVCWILTEKYKLLVVHYSDDFLLITKKDLPLARAHLRTLLQAFAYLDIPIAEDKLVGPVTHLTFLGIHIDTTDFTISIPEDKVAAIMSDMPKWGRRRTCTLTQLRSLNGKLNFFSKVIRPGRMFTRRLIKLTTTVSRPHHHITITKAAKSDLLWWCEFLKTANRSSFIPDPKFVYSTDLLLFTDASKYLGLGAVYGSKWIQSRWPPHLYGEDINFLELFTIMAAVLTWGQHWTRKRVVIVTDNKPITQVWASGTSQVVNIMTLIRKIYLFAATHHFSISFKHIFGQYNPAADALSRFQMQRFRTVMPGADTQPTDIPAAVWNWDE